MPIQTRRNEWAVFVAALLLLAYACAPQKGEKGDPGATGSTGDRGPAGEVGPAGSSCAVEQIEGGSRITCADGSVSDVYSGTEVETIELCPDTPGGMFSEYLVRIDGILYGVYYSPPKSGLAKIGVGSWVTTDGRNCHFTVTPTWEIVYE